jgi:hypothetical protein
VTVHPAPGSGPQQRSFVAVAAGSVEGAGDGDGQRHGGRLASLAEDLHNAVAALFPEVLDVYMARLGDAQPKHAEEIGQRQRVRAEGVRRVQERYELQMVRPSVVLSAGTLGHRRNSPGYRANSPSAVQCR